MTDLEDVMRLELELLDIGEVDVRPGDVPVIAMVGGVEVCSDGAGLFDVWVNERPLAFNFSSDMVRDFARNYRNAMGTT
jgi:hypothetical protein